MNTILNRFKEKKIRNWSLLALALIVVVLAARGFSPANADTSAAATEAKVVALNVAETVEASGSLEAQPFAKLDWKTSGVVESVNAQAGDFVKAGDILVTLQPSSTSASIVSAQADLVNAQKDLDDLLHSGTDAAQAAIDLKTAREDYDAANTYFEYLQTNKKVPLTTTELELQQTRNGYQYVYKTKSFRGSATGDMLVEAQNDLALKKAEFEDAQRAYDRLKEGPNPQDVTAAQAQVDAAQATVNSLSIVASFDGQVLSVDNHIGDLVGAGDLSVNLANMDHLYVETKVDESDIANIKLGNSVEVTLDAVSGLTLKGSVTAINPVGEDVSGLIKYTVRVDLDKVKRGIFLPLGTTANVVIKLKDASASLAVPITAIQNDSQGEYVWVLQGDGSSKRINVVSGAIVGSQVVVSGDLTAGDRIQLEHVNGFQAPNPFGGGK
jgi:HlyD family secretion protein